MTHTRRQIIRFELFLKQDGRCCHCQLPMRLTRNHARYPTIEHPLPKSLGGTSCAENLAVACLVCNQHKGGRIMHRPLQFKRLNQEVPAHVLAHAKALLEKYRRRLTREQKEKL